MKKTPAVIFLQARYSSTRLLGKCLKTINGKPLLGYLLDRLLLSKLPIVVLVPKVEIHYFKDLQKKYPMINFFAGNKFNVLKRFYQASLAFPATNYIRVTGDNPLTSIYCLLKLLEIHLKKNSYFSYFKNLPHGAGVEIISQIALQHAYKYVEKKYDLEHVTPWIHAQNKFNILVLPCPQEYHAPNLRVTVDNQEDFNQFKKWLETSKGFPSLKKIIKENH